MQRQIIGGQRPNLRIDILLHQRVNRFVEDVDSLIQMIEEQLDVFGHKIVLEHVGAHHGERIEAGVLFQDKRGQLMIELTERTDQILEE